MKNFMAEEMGRDNLEFVRREVFPGALCPERSGTGPGFCNHFDPESLKRFTSHSGAGLCLFVDLSQF